MSSFDRCKAIGLVKRGVLPRDIPDDEYEYIAPYAAASGRWDVFRQMLPKLSVFGKESSLCEVVMSAQSDKVLEQFFSVCPDTHVNDDVIKFAVRRDLGFVTVLLQHVDADRMFGHDILHEAYLSGDVYIVDVIHRRTGSKLCEDCVTYLLEGDSVPVLNWFPKRSEYSWSVLFEIACDVGALNVVRYIHRLYPDQCVAASTDLLRKGHLHVVGFLIDTVGVDPAYFLSVAALRHKTRIV